MAIYGALDIAKGQIDPRTVSPTQQGAMVNWLWLHGIRVMDSWPYAAIRAAFLNFNGMVELAEIEIEVLRSLDAPDTEYQDSDGPF